tara:strand:+ start:454 stop:1542 length:1089 start_codon:yes stop_codon:yes gene_type:complete
MPQIFHYREGGNDDIKIVDPLTWHGGMTQAQFLPIEGPNVWTSKDFNAEEEWVVNLSETHIGLLEAAMEKAAARNIAPQDITPDNFPLGKLRIVLDAAYETLEHGRGFLVLRGWPSKNYSHAQNLIVFCGIASYFGKAMVQNYEGEAIVDVIDKKKPYDHTSRGYMSNKRLPFHSDGADLVGLLCLGEPIEGGTSLLLSATKLYNTILNEHPEYSEIFMRGFYHHRRGQHDPGEAPISAERIPIFSFHNDLLHCCYNRNPIDWVVHEGMSLSAQEIGVLDYFDALCHRPGMAVEMIFRQGDMQFVNNFVILHSRSEYRDAPDSRRHLVRLWLENPRSFRGAQGLLDIYVPGSSKVSKEDRVQ